MNIHESAEDCLERILMARERKDIVYSIDIAHKLNFSKPGVSAAMKRLRETGIFKWIRTARFPCSLRGRTLPSISMPGNGS